MKTFLKEVSIFSELTGRELDSLAGSARESAFPKNSNIIQRGETGTSLFLVHSGKVNVFLLDATGVDVLISTLGRGSFFGEMSLFDGGPRNATVVAKEDTTIVEINKEDFIQQLTLSPKIALKLLTEIAKRFRQTNDTVREYAVRLYSETHINKDNYEKLLKIQNESVNNIKILQAHIDSEYKV